MTIDELYIPIKEAVDNGCGNINVYVREYGKSHEQTANLVELVDMVALYSSGSDCKEQYVEIVYRNNTHDEMEDIKKFNDIKIQSCRNEKQLIVDAWRKSDKESAHIIKGLLDCMQHRMRVNETKRCMDMVNEVIHNAENYVDKLESGIAQNNYTCGKGETVNERRY